MNNFQDMMATNNLRGNNTNNYNNFYGMNMAPKYNIIQVHGQNGAEALQMAPNSKVLLLDENDPIVWFVQTDGAGYKTVTPYSIKPYQPAPQVNFQTLEARIAALEEKINAKPNSGTNKQQKRNVNTESDG